jgi:hypothetical protein
MGGPYPFLHRQPASAAWDVSGTLADVTCAVCLRMADDVGIEPTSSPKQTPTQHTTPGAHMAAQITTTTTTLPAHATEPDEFENEDGDNPDDDFADPCWNE